MVKKTNELAGIDKNFIQDFLIGGAIGIAIIFLGFLVPGIGTIGIPSLPQSLSSETSRFIVIVFLASIFETFFFFDIVLSFFKDKVKRFGLNLPFILVALISAGIFSLFHLSAYTDFASNQGAFFTAFIVGIIFAYERKFTNSNLPGIATHMVLNFFIGFVKLAVIVGLTLPLL